MKAEPIAQIIPTVKANKPFFGAKKKLNVKLNKPPEKIIKPPVLNKRKKPVSKENEKSDKKKAAVSLKKPVAEIKTASKKYQKHKDPEVVREEAQKAAILPSEKANKSVADRSHVELMESQTKDTKKFDKVKFKENLKEQINDTIKSKDDAKKIKNKGVDENVTKDIGQSVEDEKSNAGGKVENSTSPPAVPKPPANEITVNEPKGLVPESPSATTQTSQKGALAPAKRPAEETDFTKETKVLDDRYSQNNLSQEKLQNSNEPSFVGADNRKQDSEAKAIELTNQTRKDENKLISNTRLGSIKSINGAYNLMQQNNVSAISGRFDKQKQKAAEENKIRNDISRELDKIFNETNKNVLSYFSAIDFYIDKIFGFAITANLEKFSNRVADLLDENTGFFNRVGAAVTGDDLLSEIEIFDIAKEEFIDDMQKPIDKLVDTVDIFLTAANNTIKKGKDDAEKFWDKQSDDTKRIAGEVYEDSNSKFEELESSVESKEGAIIDTVTEKFSNALDELDERFEKAVEENKSWLDKAIDAIKKVINTIIELKNAIKSIAKKAAQYAEEIIDDPITFFGNLGDGVGLGFDNFKKNIDKHLVKGVLEWLTGSMAGSDIVLPKELNFEGITDLVLQILGISIKKIKSLVIDVIGKERFEFIEKGVDATISAGNRILDIFKILNEKGLAGLWEFIKEEFSDLKEMLIENVKTFVVETITRKAMEFLLSLLIPGSGFIRAAQLLIRFVITLFQKAAQILKIIDGIIESFGNILRKDIAGAAEKVENVLGGFISLAISFLAAVLGLDGIVGKVQKFIQQKIRPKIDKILNSIAKKIKQVVAKIGLTKLIDKSMHAVEKGKAWVDDKKAKAKQTAKKIGEKILNFLGIKKKFKTDDGESHTLFFKGKEESLTLWVASNPKTFKDFLKQIGTVKGNKAAAKKQAENEFDELQTAISKKNTGATNDEYQKEQVKKYEKVTTHVNTLSNYMPPLFDITDIGEFKLTFGSLKATGYGTKMEVKNLHKTTRPPIGSVPGVTNDNYDILKKKRNGGSTYYILGHLLNHNLGGSGNDFRNLTPLTRKGNKDHNVQIEETVKSELAAGKVINYTVTPNYNKPNTVLNQPANISAKKKKVIEAEEKTPVRVNYLFESWDRKTPNAKTTITDSFENETDFKTGQYVD